MLTVVPKNEIKTKVTLHAKAKINENVKLPIKDKATMNFFYYISKISRYLSTKWFLCRAPAKISENASITVLIVEQAAAQEGKSHRVANFVAQCALFVGLIANSTKCFQAHAHHCSCLPKQ